MRAPIRAVLTEHAAERALRHGVTVIDIAELLLETHASRVRNTGAADWLVTAEASRSATTGPMPVMMKRPPAP